MDDFAMSVEDISPYKRKGNRRKSKRTGSLYARSDPALEINQPRRLYNGSPSKSPHLPPRPPFSPPTFWRQERDFVENFLPSHTEQSGHHHFSYTAGYPRYGSVEHRAVENRNSWNGSLQPYRPHRRTSQPRNYTPGMYNRPSGLDSFQPVFCRNNEATTPSMIVTSVPNSPRTSGPGLIVSSNLHSPHNRGPGLIVNSTSTSAHNAGPRVVSSTSSLRLNPEAREFVPATKDNEPQTVPLRHDWADEHVDAQDVQDNW